MEFELKQEQTLFEQQKQLGILVVDDNIPAADSLAKLMNKIGMQAEALYSGADALACETLNTFDVILLDIGMPEMDGYELVGHLRVRGIACPIIALTGYGLESDKQRAKDAGFSAHLTKPIGLAELRELITSLTTIPK